jgi:hypothetical protein
MKAVDSLQRCQDIEQAAMIGNVSTEVPLASSCPLAHSISFSLSDSRGAAKTAGPEIQAPNGVWEEQLLVEAGLAGGWGGQGGVDTRPLGPRDRRSRHKGGL